jgi:hypothetical protein
MWMIDPKILCDKHLLGEHGEIHKHRHNFVKQHKMTKRIFPVTQIEPSAMGRRHDELAAELLRRGMNHKSPFEQPDISYLPVDQQLAVVDPIYSLKDLRHRCSACAERIDYMFDESIDLEWEEHTIN